MTTSWNGYAGNSGGIENFREKASAEAIVIRDLGQSWSTVVCSDASQALGVIQRQGLGRLRHVDCDFLFVQSLNAAKVSGGDNPAAAAPRASMLNW